MNDSYANECIVECTDNGKTVEAEVGEVKVLRDLSRWTYINVDVDHGVVWDAWMMNQ